MGSQGGFGKEGPDSHWRVMQTRFMFAQKSGADVEVGGKAGKVTRLTDTGVGIAHTDGSKKWYPSDSFE